MMKPVAQLAVLKRENEGHGSAGARPHRNRTPKRPTQASLP